MREDLSRLPKSKKKVVAKVLSENEMSLRNIGTLLGVSKDSVNRYIDDPTPDSLRQYETDVRAAFTMREQVVAAKALARIDESMGRARITEALEVYKVMMGKDSKVQTNVQVNNFVPLLGGDTKNAVPKDNSNQQDIIPTQED